MRLLACALVVALLGCGSADEKHAGTATLVGNVEGVTLPSEHGVSIARMFPPQTELKIAPSGVACEATQAGDRITFDLGDEKPGFYTVVAGYPSKTGLSPAQARAHVCAAKPEGGQQPPCHDVVRSGQVTITRFDAASGGSVEGTYVVELADGKVSGKFSAYRCD